MAEKADQKYETQTTDMVEQLMAHDCGVWCGSAEARIFWDGVPYSTNEGYLRWHHSFRNISGQLHMLARSSGV